EDLAAAVARSGYRLTKPVAAADPAERERAASEAAYRNLRRKFVFAAFAAAASMLLSMPLMEGSGAAMPDLFHRLMMPVSHGLRAVFPWLYAAPPTLLAWALFVLTTPVLFWSGRQFFR